MLRRIGFTLAFLAFALPQSVQAQTQTLTDEYCQTPGTRAYATVCQTDELYWRDNAMNDVYARAKANTPEAEISNLRNAQRYWIKFRNSCDTDVACLKTAYDDRLFSLEATAGNTIVLSEAAIELEVRNPLTGWGPCALEESVKDPVNGADMSLIIQNRSGSYRGLVTIDSQGRFRDQGGLNEGERLLVNTRVGTPWVVTDGPGNCLEMIFPREDLFRYNLTVPDAFFGPE